MPSCAPTATALAASFERLVAQIATLTARIGHAVAQLPEGRIVCPSPAPAPSAPPRSPPNSATCAARLSSADALAMEAGVAPVTRQSGKTRAVVFQWACNKRLRAALTCLADNRRHACAWAAEIYRRARNRGCDHPHAVRILAHAWTRVLWRAWQDGKPYHPGAHAAATHFTHPQPA